MKALIGITYIIMIPCNIELCEEILHNFSIEGQT